MGTAKLCSSEAREGHQQPRKCTRKAAGKGAPTSEHSRFKKSAGLTGSAESPVQRDVYVSAYILTLGLPAKQGLSLQIGAKKFWTFGGRSAYYM